MTISIHHRLKPFSHVPGQKYLIPGSTTTLQVYPCLIVGQDLLDQAHRFTIQLEFKDFIGAFTAEVDYQKNHLRIFGKHKDGYSELKIFKVGEELKLSLERHTNEALSLKLNSESIILPLKNSVKINDENHKDQSLGERLDLGVSKLQDIDRICQQMNLKEMFPYIFSLGSSLQHLSGPFSYQLKQLLSLDENQKRKTLEKIFYGNFSCGFIPSVKDEKHLGLINFLENETRDIDLLIGLYIFLKAAFVYSDGGDLKIFHHVPKDFVAGKVINLALPFGKMHIEWTKGFLRKLVLIVDTPIEVSLCFPKCVKNYRVRKNNHKIALSNQLTEGVYLFDKFEA
jgi:hypothetical protein